MSTIGDLDGDPLELINNHLDVRSARRMRATNMHYKKHIKHACDEEVDDLSQRNKFTLNIRPYGAAPERLTITGRQLKSALLTALQQDRIEITDALSVLMKESTGNLENAGALSAALKCALGAVSSAHIDTRFPNTTLVALGKHKNITDISIELTSNIIKTLVKMVHIDSLDDLSQENNKPWTIMRSVAKMKQLTALNIARSDFDDVARALKELPKLENLQRLNVSALDVTSPAAPAGVLPKLLKLKELNASHCEMIDLSPLKALSKMEILDVSYNGVGNIEVVKSMPQLRKLRMWFCGVEPKQLLPLKELAQFKHLEYFEDNDDEFDEWRNARLPIEVARDIVAAFLHGWGLACSVDFGLERRPAHWPEAWWK